MIDFGTAVRRFYANYIIADGRAQRSAYWWVLLYQLIIYAVLMMVLYMADGGKEFFIMLGQLLDTGDTSDIDPDLALGTSGIMSIFLMLCFAMVNFLPSIMLNIRRFHDLGQSGWLVLVFKIIGAIPGVGMIADIGNIIWFIFPGTAGTNLYGPDPLGHDTDIFG